MVEIFDNIRKIYRFSDPCAELADHIEFFSESSSEETDKHISGNYFTVKMFPSWTPTFYINLGVPYRLVSGSKNFYVGSENDVLILRNSIVERQNLVADHIFTVKFFPGGLESVLGINQTVMADKIIDLNTIIPQAIIQKVKDSNSFPDRMLILQNYFLSAYHKRKSRDHYVKFVQDTIGVFESAAMRPNNSQLAEKMFVTSKTINRYFNKVVGTSPKKYFSIFRARVALSAYVADQKHFVPDAFGYYDMSHFYKDVQQFTGKKLTLHMS